MLSSKASHHGGPGSHPGLHGERPHVGFVVDKVAVGQIYLRADKCVNLTSVRYSISCGVAGINMKCTTYAKFLIVLPEIR
jgi:hypothetical protein